MIVVLSEELWRETVLISFETGTYWGSPSLASRQLLLINLLGG